MEYTPRHGRFRALLRKIRQEAGLSQVELSRKLGKAQTFVSKSEIGERRLDFLETVDFCVACDVTIAAFAERLNEGEIIRGKTQRQKRTSPRAMAADGRMIARSARGANLPEQISH